MRQKRIKGIDKNTLETKGVIVQVVPLTFSNNNKICLEIGSGKGQFISGLAKENPDFNYIAIEAVDSVCYRILQKKEEYKLDNLTIICNDAKHIKEYLGQNKVSLLYLNFSDPWPKKRNHKRRLTHPTFLKEYLEILDSNAIIQFRTDHKELFLDSVAYINSFFDIIEIEYNLPESIHMTEYETKKRLFGQIYQLKAKVGIKNEQNL